MTPRWRACLCLVLMSVATVVVVPASTAQSLTDGRWHVTLDTDRAGPIDTVLTFEERNGVLVARSVSGALDLIRDLPGTRDERVDVSKALFAFTLERTDAGYHGTLTAPWPGHGVTLTPTAEGFSGEIDDGLLRGPFSGEQAGDRTDAPLRDYPAILETMHAVVATKIFDPADMVAPGYRTFATRMQAIADAARDDLDVILGFRFAWVDDPFSHFELRRAAVSAEGLIRGFDHMRVGYEAARVEYDGDVAILTVDTMMGDDTIEYIEAAYNDITAKGAGALVIDLRGNGGGAFAIKPLVEHVIDVPLDAGYFLSHRWNTEHDGLPRANEVTALEPWEGWSIIAFWTSVQNDGLMKIRFEPREPRFDGPVFVVTDGRSASATELAADAFRASGAATLVGEQTAGHMLSQSFFDVTDGFLVSLPVADYFSVAHGRIEGVGVPPDIAIASDGALDRAKALARAAIAERQR